MIHIRVDEQDLNSERRFACGLGPDLPAGDTYRFLAETANPFILHDVDCQKCNPGRGEAPHASTPLSRVSGRPGHPGYDEFVRIAESWGYN